MADAVLTNDNPTLRMQIARMLGGDSKPGSIRHHLADALAGGQVEGAGSPLPLLTTMTPLGAVTAIDEANRAAKQGNIGQAAISAMGAIPGAGRGAKAMASEIIENLSKHAPEKLDSLMGSLSDIGLRGGDPAEFMSRAFYGHELQDMLKKSQEMKAASAAAAYDASRMPKLDRVSKPNDEVSQLKSAVDKRRGGPVQTPAAKDDAAMAEHDALKQNFIKNAMDDEGGNVPEEVAQTLLDHVMQKGKLDEFSSHLDLSPDMKYDDILNHLVENHSIPDMLSMHYDLNPGLMGKAYEMPATVSRKGMKPTQ